MYKDLIKGVAARMGYRIENASAREMAPGEFNPYHMAIFGLLTRQKDIGIVIVGANDGKINDPIFDLIEDQISERVQMILIEPQVELFPFIEKNYSFLSRKRVINCAVGIDGWMTIYTIKEEFWHKGQPAYAKNWPTYRAPTGVASPDRARVIAWAKKYIRDYPPDEVIATRRISSRRLKEIILEEKIFLQSFDVLQIDVEGGDDEVIYGADIEVTKPAIIYFESKGLGVHRATRLYDFLKSNKYSLHQVGGDTLALLMA